MPPIPDSTQIALLLTCVLALCSGGLVAQEKLAPIPAIERKLPPQGIKLSSDAISKLQAELSTFQQRLDGLDHELKPDTEIYAKAVRYAIEFGEFYDQKHLDLAHELLTIGSDRLDQLEKNRPAWVKQAGLVVRGYRSVIDDCVQPYGLEIPAKLNLSKPVTLYVWLHGRGDKTTDLHFIAERAKRPGQIQPANAIVLHPFGRQCVGFKSAGEIDILEAIAHVQSQYPIDERRIVLMGFSMGGAGAWHLGAHYPQMWCAVSPGAGFAETAQYNNLQPDKYPAIYVQQLWKTYDVPNYARNLFNMPVVAYSGEIDKQIQAARVMEKAFSDQGHQLTHVIGPGMGHKYHPDSLKAIMATMQQAAAAGQTEHPERIWLQTCTLRYHRAPGVELLGLGEHWQDARVDARQMAADSYQVVTHNVTALRFPTWQKQAAATIEIDGQQLLTKEIDENAFLLNSEQGWQWNTAEQGTAMRKTPGLQGPIDDAFLEPFLVVLPSGNAVHPLVDRWVKFESQHFQQRWRSVMRGEIRFKQDHQVTADDIHRFHLILWGDPQSNQVIKRLMPTLPLQWDPANLKVNGKSYDAQRHVPTLVYPNPENPQRYVVLNSGITFRENQDRTNSLQNPQLPDWAVIDLSELPDAESPGKIVAADFFDEAWQFK